jgi:hypothetical protein
VLPYTGYIAKLVVCGVSPSAPLVCHSEPIGYSGSVVSIEKSPEPVTVNAFVVYPREGPSGTDVEVNPVEACFPSAAKGGFEESKCTWIGWVSDTSFQFVGLVFGTFPVFDAVSEM